MIPTPAIAFAAFCFWQAMRVVNRKERWAKLTLAAIAMIAAYPLSCGPAVWLVGHGCVPSWMCEIYMPLEWLLAESNTPEWYGAYMSWWWNHSPIAF